LEDAAEALRTCAVAAFDHYKCYHGKDLRTPPFDDTTAATSDQFGTETVEVERLRYVCAPTDKDGQGMQDPFGHFACYSVRSAPVTSTVEVETQFGTSRFRVKKAKLICAPTTKAVLP
jgi:hypothetical protein